MKTTLYAINEESARLFVSTHHDGADVRPGQIDDTYALTVSEHGADVCDIVIDEAAWLAAPYHDRIVNAVVARPRKWEDVVAFRPREWFDHDGNQKWETVEISTDGNRVILEHLTRIEGRASSAVFLPASMLPELLEAYDNGDMDRWMHDNADTLAQAEVIYTDTPR